MIIKSPRLDVCAFRSAADVLDMIIKFYSSESHDHVRPRGTGMKGVGGAREKQL